MEYSAQNKSWSLRFQKEHRLNADALVGPKTKAMLKKVYNGEHLHQQHQLGDIL